MPPLQIRLNRPQSLAHQALRPGNSVCAPWGRGIGKSHFLRLSWALLVAQWDGVLREGALKPLRGVRITHVMPTFKQCKDVHGQLTEEDFAPSGPWGFLGAKINHTTWEIGFPGGSIIRWISARTAATSGRGIRTDVATFDECDDIDPGLVDAVSAPWFSEPWSLRVRYFSGTPRRGRYGLLYREHRAGLDGERARRIDLETVADPAERRRLLALRHSYSFHATYRSAPETVDAAYVEEVRARTPPEVFRREWECDFDSAEGLVYNVFREDYHVRAPDPRLRFSEILIGVDHGYEDPGVFVVIGVQGHGADAVLWLLEEVYQRHQVEGWWVDKARELDAKYRAVSQHVRWYADPSLPSRIEALRRDAKLGSRIEAGNNSIDDGVSAVVDRIAVRVREGEARCTACGSVGCRECRDRVGYARFYVHPKCTQAIREFGAYRRKRDPKDPDRMLDAIEDKNNHGMDGVRYAVFTRFGKPSYSRTESGAGW